MTPSPLRRIKFFCRFSEGAGITVLLIGLAALGGWLLDAGILKSFYPGLLPMRPNTAVCFVLLGLGAWLSQDRFAHHRRWLVIAQGCGWLVAAVAMATLAEHIIARNLGIDQLLFAKETGAAYATSPGRITGMSSFVLLFLGLALVGLDAKTAWGLQVTQMFGCLAGIGSMLAVCGYAYSLWDVFGPSVSFAAMSLPAACASVLAWAAIFYARPEGGLMGILTSSGMGGTMARVLLPAAVLVPLLIDLATVPEERGGPISLETNSAINMAVTITLFAGFILFAARRLNQKDGERRRMEEAVRNSKGRLALAQASAHSGVWDYDFKTQRATWTEEQEALFGFASGTYDGAPGTFEQLLHPDDRPRLGQAIARAVEVGSYNLEFRATRRDGALRWFAGFGQAYRDEAGQPGRMIGINIDITERKQAEIYNELGREILQILNEPGEIKDSIQRVVATLKRRTGFDAIGIRLKDGDDFPYFAQQGFPRDFLLTENTLVERAVDGGLCRDKDGNIRLECTCGLVISGKTDPANPCFTQGGSFWTNDSFPLLHLPPDQDPRLHPRNQCIHQGCASVALVPIRDKDRIVGLIQLNDRRKGCFTLNTVELLEGIASHIGAALMRKRAEEKIQELSRAVEQSPASIVITDPAGNIEYVNPKFAEVTGYAPAEVLGKNPRVLKSGEKSPEAYRELWETITAGKEWRGEFHNKKKNGELYWESASISPIRDLAGRVTHYVAVKEDITRQKQTEAERERLVQDLQKNLALVKSLSGLLPICAGCKKIRDDRGYWNQVESYIQKHSEATFTHGLCPDCIKKYYPELGEGGHGHSHQGTT